MKYLNAVLTVIAVCLVLITFAVTGLIPTAQAKESPQRFVSVPLNPDGSLNVRMVKGETMDVNITHIRDVYLPESTLPFSTREAIPVNISQVNGSRLQNNGIPVYAKETMPVMIDRVSMDAAYGNALRVKVAN